MSYSIIFSKRFLRQVRRLNRKYRSFADDLQTLGDSLLLNPLQGAALGRNCYKVRMAIASKGKGKSGGARVITLVRVEAGRLILLTVYDKADRPDLAPGELDALLMEAGLGGE